MADETGKIAASPLHDASAEEEESKSSVTPVLQEGEPEKTAVDPKESGSAPAGEMQVPAPVDAPAEGAAAGVFQDPEKQKRIEFEKEQEQLKKKILSDIHARREKLELERIAKEDGKVPEGQPDQTDQQQAPAEELAPPEEQAPAEELKLDPPFNVFGPTIKEAVLQVKEEPEGSDDEPENLVLNDLRKCEKCGGMSYLRQGLCVNVYCSLYYMWNPQAGTRLTARGKINEGKKWSPSEWGKSQYQRVEEALLSTAFKDEVKKAQKFGDPPMEIASKAAMEIASKAKELAAASSSNPIEIEDMETGEIHQHGGEEADGGEKAAEYVQNWSAEDKAADYIEPVSPQLLEATRKVRNKGWKRVASLAAKITEKKQRGEWLGPDVPIPKNVLPFLKDRIQLVEKKDQQ